MITVRLLLLTYRVMNVVTKRIRVSIIFIDSTRRINIDKMSGIKLRVVDLRIISNLMTSISSIALLILTLIYLI